MNIKLTEEQATHLREVLEIALEEGRDVLKAHESDNVPSDMPVDIAVETYLTLIATQQQRIDSLVAIKNQLGK